MKQNATEMLAMNIRAILSCQLIIQEMITLESDCIRIDVHIPQ